MMKKLPFLLIAFAGVGLSQPLFAQTTIPDSYPSLYRGTRPLGMGNAFIAMPGQDENAPFYNPAATNDYEKKLHFRILSPSFAFSTGVISLVQDVIDLADQIDGEGSNGAKIDDFRAFVDQHIGEFHTVSFQMPVIQAQHKWFHAAILADSRNAFSFRNRAFTNVEISSRSDLGGVFGGAYGFFDDKLQAGANMKILHRVSINETITADDIINSANFSDTLPIRRATGVGVDLGVKGTIPTFDVGVLEFLKPTAGLTYQDIGNTRFSGAIPNTPQSVSVGFALHPTWGDWKFHFANDFRELNQDTDFIKKWNVGVEAQAPKLWGFFSPSARVGADQGYIAAGTSLDFRYAKLEFATFAEDAGLFSRQKGIRQIAGNLSFGF